jgi:hypothetical protein
MADIWEDLNQIREKAAGQDVRITAAEQEIKAINERLDDIVAILSPRTP